MMPAADLTRLTAIIERIRAVQGVEAVADDSPNKRIAIAAKKISDLSPARIASIARKSNDSSPERIAAIAGRISEALLSHFVKVERPGFQRLYDALSGGGVPTATLSVCGRGTREIRYTQLMRYFLDPNELHGLGDRVLRAALHTFDVNVQDLDLQKAVVKAEESLGKVKTKKGEVGCTLDLLIEIDGIYVLVEHKINSGEGEGLDETTGQVARYDKAVAKNLPHITESNSTRVYLTRTGKEAKGDVDWIPVAHRDLLRSFVAILEDASLSAVALHNLCAFLWDLLMGPIGIDALRLSELRNHINGALHNPPQSIRLKQWCDTNDIPWQNIIYILEKSYG